MNSPRFVTIGLALITVILLIAAYGVTKSSSQRSPSHNWNSYTNTPYQFSLKYPKDYSAISGDSPSYPAGSHLVTTGQQHESVPVIETLVREKSSEEKTNFAGAWLSVSVVPENDATRCQETTTGEGVTPLDAEKTINSTHWNTDAQGWTATAAAGTKFETRIFHALHNQDCYEISLNLATANIENYPPGTVTAVDEKSLKTQLESIAETFQFTK